MTSPESFFASFCICMCTKKKKGSPKTQRSGALKNSKNSHSPPETIAPPNRQALLAPSLSISIQWAHFILRRRSQLSSKHTSREHTHRSLAGLDRHPGNTHPPHLVGVGFDEPRDLHRQRQASQRQRRSFVGGYDSCAAGLVVGKTQPLLVCPRRDLEVRRGQNGTIIRHHLFERGGIVEKSTMENKKRFGGGTFRVKKASAKLTEDQQQE